MTEQYKGNRGKWIIRNTVIMLMIFISLIQLTACDLSISNEDETDDRKTGVFFDEERNEYIVVDLENYKTADKTEYSSIRDLYAVSNDSDFTPSEIDWDGLAELNGEIYAWIEFESPDLDISYPVVHSSVTNEYYSNHTVNGTENSAGSIYIDKSIDPYFGYVNTIIYGHNMENGTMFGNLKKYKDETFYAGREYFWIYTPESRSRYEIFACYENGESSSTYSWWAKPCDEYTAYLESSKASSIYDTGVELSPSDKIVTLSTCTAGDSKRMIVQAKLVYTEMESGS